MMAGRIALAKLGGRPWNEELVLQRYELLYEAGLVLEARRNGKAARIYAITRYGRSEDHALALASGFDGHFTKPVDPNVVLRLLEKEPVGERAAQRTH